MDDAQGGESIVLPRPRPRLKLGAAMTWLALAWGLAEATIFFIVPDVLLTWVALRSMKRGLWLCAAAVIGAVIGGVIMWGWGRMHPTSAIAALDYIPAVSPEMIASVRDEILERGPAAVLFGPPQGTPYKIYAVQAGAAGMSLGIFAIISLPARAIRFVLLTLLAGAVSNWTGHKLSSARKRIILVIVWIAFYGWYFAIMPN